MMLWIKVLHVVTVIGWFAGLFYLPRIFVNLAMVSPESVAERQRLLLMARKLLRFMNFLAIPALLFGLLLWLYYGIGRGPGNAWLHIKMLFVLLTLGLHHGCGRILRQFENGVPVRSHQWYRWFNEIPVLLLCATVALVVIKPTDLIGFFGQLGLVIAALLLLAGLYLAAAGRYRLRVEQSRK